ncbi:ATP-dependent RNA helicase RhlE [subsurface metagenome]
MKENYFTELDLIEPIQRVLRENDFKIQTPIQEGAIPLVLEGRDLIGCAQTGSGKTAAFALPILQNLSKNQSHPVRRSTRALVLAPTRELAVQIAECFSLFGSHLRLRQAVVYGGVSRRAQIKKLERGVDILVATPGRLLDLMEDAKIVLGLAKVLVIDEADRMLDMGFIPDIKRIIAALPGTRQTLFFSATMPPAVIGLAGNILHEPQHIEIASNVRTTPLIDQKVLFVDRNNKKALLIKLLNEENIRRALVFTRTKYMARDLSRQLVRHRVRSDDLHGDKTQAARQQALNSFHTGRIQVLVATDIASRGIDVDNVSHVINYELPNEPENYIHRIGRTGRAGKKGTALSFCEASEVVYLRQIERVIKKQLPVWEAQPFHSRNAAACSSSGKRRSSASPARYAGSSGRRRSRAKKRYGSYI